MNMYLATVAVLLVYLIFVWFLGNILHLHGRDIWVLRIGLGVIGIIGAGVFLWFKRREQKLAAGEGSQDTGGPGHEEIDALIRDAEARVAGARSLHTRLSEISQALGINLPVYVLFTRTDRLPFFNEYVRNLSNEEATQVLGVTLPMAERSSGVYAEQQGQRLSAAFNDLYYSLCDKRPEFLAREHDGEKLPGIYEFPREFRKLRGAMVQFLVDLARPSQLTTGPFLRGFYFSGVRPVFVNEVAPAVVAPRSQEAQGFGASREATGFFRMGQQQQPLQ